MQADRPPRTGSFRGRDGTFDGRLVAGNNHLPRRVEVDRLADLAARRLPARGGNRFVVESEDGGHAADAPGHGRLHQLGTTFYDRQRVAETDGAGGHQRRVFAQAVAGHLPRFGTAHRLPDPPGRNSGGQHRRLRDDSFVEFFGRPVLHELP